MDKIEIQRTIQDRLERLLETEKISKAELARRSGLPSRTVENYFKGHTPSLEALVAISEGNRIPIDALLSYLGPSSSLD